MKTIRIEEPGKIVLAEAERPALAKEEILLRLKYVGFCGSDLGTYLGKNPMVRYPRVPGHEISGVIEALGAGVPGGFEEGEAVTVVPYTSCGQCPSCRRGRSHACQFNQTLGVQRDGAMQEYIAVHWKKILKAPALGALELAMVEPLTVGFHAIERGRVSGNDTVMVLGCGMIGAGAIAGAALRGARVVAVDIERMKLDLATELGARHALNATGADFGQELMKLTGGNGPDVVVEAAGNPVTYRQAVEQVAFTGRVVCIGYAGSDVRLPTKLFVQKELDILGSRNAAPEDFQAVISYLERGDFPLNAVITNSVPPEDAGEALAQWASDPGKVMKILVKF